jgi:hypothetical protein
VVPSAQSTALSTGGPTTAPDVHRIPTPDAPTVTALLLDRLSPHVRPLAQRAALTFVDTIAPLRDYAGVFLPDLSFQTFQSFTNDQNRRRDAIDIVAMTAPTNLRPEEQAKSQRAAQLNPTTPPTAGAESPCGTVTQLEREKGLEGMDPAERGLAEMEYRMEQSCNRLLNEAQGQAKTAGLRAAISALAP